MGVAVEDSAGDGVVILAAAVVFGEAGGVAHKSSSEFEAFDFRESPHGSAAAASADGPQFGPDEFLRDEVDGAAVAVAVDGVGEGVAFGGFGTGEANEVAVAGAELHGAVLDVAGLIGVGDAGAFVVIFKCAGLDAVLLGEGKTKAEFLENRGVFKIDIAGQACDFVALLETEVIHVLASSDFDLLAVVVCVFAHGRVLLRWWG